METETIAPGTALALIPTITPMQVYADGAAQALIDRIEADVRAVKTDVTTAKGRAEIGSLARKVAKGLSVEHAIIAVTAIAKGDVPGATINY